MKPDRSRLLVGVWSVALALCAATSSTALKAEEPKGNFEVHDLSLWILEPGSSTANLRTAYPSALGGLTNSTRTAPAKGARRVGPINLITFYGQPATNLDVDLRTKAGSFVAHWPNGEGLPNRLRWSGMPSFDLVEKAEDSEMAFVDADHWIRKAREGQALFVKHGARVERFLAYDAELTIAPPIRLEGGPDKFNVINTSNAAVYDVLISRATPQGRRLAWIDVLPKSEPLKKAAPGAETKEARPKAAKAAADLFDDAVPAKPAELPTSAAKLFGGLPAKPADASQPAPKAAPANPVDAKPATATAKLFGGLPGKPDSGKKDQDKKDKPQEEKKPAGEDPAKAKEAEAAAKLFGGLIGRLTGAPMKVPAAAPAKAPEAKAEAPAPALKGVEVTLGEPIAPGSDEAVAKTTKELTERMTRAGLGAQEIELFLANYGDMFFEGEAVVVACRLGAGAIDEKIPLSIFPEPPKTVRVAMVLERNADPQLGSEVDRLIAQLGDKKFAVREAAQRRLNELGPLAFAALQKALTNSDLEIVIRAERTLLNQSQTPNPTPQAAPAAAPAAPAVRRVNK